ncbi:MAG: hypothetical protein K8U03_11740 [Planctomycetia bacterium]|nr:hypothetical protein [Planctomycetia bacterium]
MNQHYPPSLSRDGQQLRMDSRLSAMIPEIRSKCLEFSGGPRASRAVRPAWFDLLSDARPPKRSLAKNDTSANRATIGLEAIVRYMILSRTGRQEPFFVPRPIGRIRTIEGVQGHAAPYAAIPEFIAANPGGVIGYAADVDRAMAISAIAEAFPEARIFIVASSYRQRRQMSQALRALGWDVTELAGRSTTVKLQRLCVGVRGDLGLYSAEFHPEVVRTTVSPAGTCAADDVLGLEHVNLLLFLDAEHAAGDRSQDVILACRQARLFAFSPSGRWIAPRNADRVVATFGLNRITVLDHERTARPVQTAWIDHADAPTLKQASEQHAVTIWRHGMWRNGPRNRRLIGLVRALSSRSGADRRRQLKLPADRPLRTVLLMSAPEHEQVLRNERQSPPPPPCSWGFGLYPLKIENDAECLLLSVDDAEKVDFATVDAVVWAGAGDQGFTPTLDQLAATRPDQRPLYLIDVSDKAGDSLARMVRRRDRRYRDLGWHGVGEDPIAAAARRFRDAPHRRDLQ